MTTLQEVVSITINEALDLASDIQRLHITYRGSGHYVCEACENKARSFAGLESGHHPDCIVMKRLADIAAARAWLAQKMKEAQ